MLKSDLRKEYLGKRAGLSDEYAEFCSLEILARFLDFFKVQNRANINIFLPIVRHKEVNTWHFVQWFFQHGVVVSVPKIEGDFIAAVDLLPGSELVTHRWGIAEPQSSVKTPVQELDFVLTPMLYCDTEGNRVGYGKGFYDRFFAELSPKTRKVGLNYFAPKESIDDVDALDIPLDYLVTPEEVLSFGSFGSKLSK